MKRKASQLTQLELQQQKDDEEKLNVCLDKQDAVRQFTMDYHKTVRFMEKFVPTKGPPVKDRLLLDAFLRIAKGYRYLYNIHGYDEEDKWYHLDVPHLIKEYKSKLEAELQEICDKVSDPAIKEAFSHHLTEVNAQVAIWNKVDKLKCLLCNAIMDNYDYLFFGCEFSLKVWKFFKDMMRCGDAPDNQFLLLTILYLDLLGSTIYYIWIERNNRLFQRHSRSVDDICSIIKDSVRIRSDVSPLEDNHGKRPNSCVAPIDEVLNKVLDRIAFDKSISKQMVCNKGVCDSGKVYGSKSNVPSYCSIDGNDDPLFSKPCAPYFVVVEDCNRVLKDKGSGLDVCVDPLLVSNDTSKLNMADEEHGEDESIRKANKDGLDGMNVDSDFVFGDLKRNNVFLIDLLLGNGTKRIAISVDDIKKGSEACNEEGMKVVLESGPWMINNVPLVLNVWEPGLCKIMSGVGKPMLMDKLTRERWLKKAGKLDFARVLVEVSASDELPNVLEIEYPVIRVGLEELNKPMSVQSGLKYTGNLNRNNYSFQNRGYHTSSRLNGNFGRPNVARRGPNQQDINVRGGFKSQSNGVKDMGIGKALGKEKSNGVISSMANVVPALKKSIKPPDDREVRGYGSNKQMGDKDEDIHVKNSFQVLEDHEMKDKEDCFLNSVHDEYKNVVWPKLKCKVEDVMKSGIDPYWKIIMWEFDDKGMAVEMKFGMDSGIWDLDLPNASSCKVYVLLYGGITKVFRVFFIGQRPQIMNVFVEAINGNQKKFCSFVYGHYKEYVRKSLWKDLSLHFLVVKNAPWVLLGDFNVILEPSERSFGYSGLTFALTISSLCSKNYPKYFFWPDVKKQLVKHFMNVLGSREMVAPIHEPTTLFVNKLSLVDVELMVKPISLEEIKDVLFSMNDDKAPGPDGYSAKFFKAAWSVVGSEFSQAILDFFINVIKSALDEFSRISGLKPSMEKSMVFLVFFLIGVKALIGNRGLLQQFPPYLVLVSPLISAKTVQASLLQLIKSVISSLQVYWSSVLILPKFVYNEIEKLMRNFLWSQGNSHRGKAKMKWKDVCNLKEHDGLGIKSLHLWNVALMSKNIWNIVSKEDSLWVKWVNSYRLIDRRSNFSLKVWKFFKDMMRCGDAPDNLFLLLTILYLDLLRHSRSVDDICSIIKDSVRFWVVQSYVIWFGFKDRCVQLNLKLHMFFMDDLLLFWVDWYFWLIPGGNELCKWEICSLKTRGSFCICSNVLDWRCAQAMEMQGDKVYVEVVVSSSM
ncbi:hypothetical protein Tco_0660956, partial [Tanacetum coccineum]